MVCWNENQALVLTQFLVCWKVLLYIIATVILCLLTAGCILYMLQYPQDCCSPAEEIVLDFHKWSCDLVPVPLVQLDVWSTQLHLLRCAVLLYSMTINLLNIAHWYCCHLLCIMPWWLVSCLSVSPVPNCKLRMEGCSKLKIGRREAHDTETHDPI